MSNSKLDKDFPLIEKCWKEFIDIIKEKLISILIDQKKCDMQIEEIEKIKSIIKMSKSDISRIIKYSKSFVEISKDLAPKFQILEAFHKKNNLDNDIALEIYDEIINEPKILEFINKLSELQMETNAIQDRIECIKDLIYGDDYSQLNFISEMCDIHKLEPDKKKKIFLYPIIKTLRKEPVEIEKQEQIEHINKKIKPLFESSQIQETQTNEDIQLSSEEIVDETEHVMNEEKSYEEYYYNQKNRYKNLKEKTNSLLTKYYITLYEMKPYEMQYYKAFAAIEKENTNIEDESENIGYLKARGKILALKLFDSKEEIEKLLISISESNYTDKNEIEYLEEYISEFEKLSEELNTIDIKISKKETELTTESNSNVYFLNDGTGTFIPEEIRTGVFQRGLLNILNKAELGSLYAKQKHNIMPLKLSFDRTKDKFTRTVFATKNDKVMLSYVKLNKSDINADQGGIIIITATLGSSGHQGIQDQTYKVIKDNMTLLNEQIELLEMQNEQQLQIQTKIKQELLSGVQALGEEENNEHKLR